MIYFSSLWMNKVCTFHVHSYQTVIILILDPPSHTHTHNAIVHRCVNTHMAFLLYSQGTYSLLSFTHISMIKDYKYMHIYVYTYICILYICIYVYIYTYTHTHIYPPLFFSFKLLFEIILYSLDLPQITMYLSLASNF